MLEISQQQALQRWDTLPLALREAMFSEEYTDVLWKFCAAEHLSEEKTQTVATIVGDVMMGFLHPEDLAREIKNTLNINQEIANGIANEVDRKIFSQIRGDLKKVYKAPTAEAGVVDLRRTTPPPVRPKLPIKPASTPAIHPFGMPVQEKPVEVPKVISTEEKSAPPSPMPMPGGESKLEAPAKRVNFEEEAPVIIHKAEEIKQVQKVSKPSFGGLFGFLRRSPKKKVEERPVAARVEIGTPPRPVKKVDYKPISLPVKKEAARPPLIKPAPPPPPPNNLPTFLKNKTEPSVIIQNRPVNVFQEKPRVVHYSNLKTPLLPKQPEEKALPPAPPPKPAIPPPSKPPKPQIPHHPVLEKKPAPPPPPHSQPLPPPPRPQHTPPPQPKHTPPQATINIIQVNPENRTKPTPIVPAAPPHPKQPEPKKEIKLSEIPIKENGEEDIVDLRTMQRLKRK